MFEAGECHDRVGHGRDRLTSVAGCLRQSKERLLARPTVLTAVGTALKYSYDPATGKATLTWLLPFFAKFRRILLQVILLAVAVSLLSLLFPIFTEMVVDKVIVEKDIGLLGTILMGMVAALFFVQASSLAQEYLLSFAAVRLDTAILDFLSRQLLALPMTYFTSRRTGDIQRRLDGARQVRQFAPTEARGPFPWMSNW